MDNPTIYFLKDINKTHAVYKAISHMEEEVLSGLDKAIKENYLDWLDDNWFVYSNESLHDDWAINIIKKEWSWNTEKGVDSAIWTYLQLNGDDPIWSLFGVNDGSNETVLKIELNFAFLGPTESGKYLSEFDKKNQQLLEENGFKKKGGNKNRYYEKQVILKTESVISGLENDEWEDALRQIQNTYENVINKIEWDFLQTSLMKYKKQIK